MKIDFRSIDRLLAIAIIVWTVIGDLPMFRAHLAPILLAANVASMIFGLTLFVLIYLGLRWAFIVAGVYCGLFGTIVVSVYGLDYFLHFFNSPLSNPVYLGKVAVTTSAGLYCLYRYCFWDRHLSQGPY